MCNMNFADLTALANDGDDLAAAVLEMYPTEAAYNAMREQREVAKAEYAAKRDAEEAAAMRSLHDYQTGILSNVAATLRYS